MVFLLDRGEALIDSLLGTRLAGASLLSFVLKKQTRSSLPIFETLWVWGKLEKLVNLDYILGGGGGVGRRIRSSGSIEGKDPVRRSKKWVEESFQPWNITVSCSSSVYFWLGYFWEVLKECLIFDFETKLHPRSLNHFLHGDINVCLIFMLPANFTAQED